MPIAIAVGIFLSHLHRQLLKKRTNLFFTVYQVNLYDPVTWLPICSRFIHGNVIFWMDIIGLDLTIQLFMWKMPYQVTRYGAAKFPTVVRRKPTAKFIQGRPGH